MNEQELLKNKMQYEMSVNFFRGLLNNGQLKEKEFKKAVKYVADKYNIETIELELAKRRYPNLQAETSTMDKPLIYESVTGESETKYISLTDISKNFSDAAPSYVIQSWMRSDNTTEFLHLWEQRHNDSYNVGGYEELRAKLKTGTFTMTPKQWIEQTGAIGITSKSGKNGGTYAHSLLACEFMLWLSPEYKLNLLEVWSRNLFTI